MAGEAKVPGLVEIAYHTDLNEVLADARLAALSAAAAAPFDRIAWWQGLSAHCGVAPLIAVARQGDAIAVLPLARGRGRIEALANYYSFRWRPLLCPDASPLLLALARDLARNPLWRAGRITLAPLPDEDGSATLVAAAFAAAGWVVEREVADINHFLGVGGRDFAAYLSARPGAVRNTLARKAGHAACTVHTKFTETLWATYQDVYADSWKPAEGSLPFLRDFAAQESAAGRLRLGVARATGEGVGQPLAVQLWSVESGTAFIHKLAYRQDARARSPGTLLTAAMLAHVIDKDRVAQVDYGTGDEAYKRDWMEAARPRWRLDMFHPGDLRHWPHILRAKARALNSKSSRGWTSPRVTGTTAP